VVRPKEDIHMKQENTLEKTEVLKALHHRPGLSTRIRYLASIEALVALGEEHLLHSVFHMALDEEIDFTEIHETLLQACLFCGFPRTINSFSIFNRCLGERGIDPAENAHIPLDDRKRADMDMMGLNLFRTIYSFNHMEVLGALKESHPELPGLVLGILYGKILSRPALDPKTRELAAVAALTVMKVYPQLFSHIKGGLNLGADFREVREVILQMEVYAPGDAIRKSLRILDLGTRSNSNQRSPTIREVS